MNAIDRLLKPRSVAVVGASADLTKTSGKPVAYLKKHGYRGAIFPVNPRVSDIAGLRCYPDVASLPQAPDVAIVLLAAGKAVSAVRELAAIGTGAAIVLASGYAELGEEGARRQQELKEAAGAMRLLGPNTIGLVNVTDGISLSASGSLEAGSMPSGHVALISQSGGILGSLLSRGAAQGIGFSKLISTSNEADLELVDFIEALLDDPATHVIALYMETLRDPQRFRQVAARARQSGKPIVVFKVGRSESGARSAVSHTGAMAGSDRMYDALFQEAGVLRVHDFADLLNVPAALAAGRTLAGDRIAILTSTGGAGTLVADSLGLAGFHTPVPDADTAARLRGIQNEQAALDRNPIDVTLAGLDPVLLRGAISALMESDGYDGIVVIVGSSALSMPALMADAIADCLPLSDRPVVAYVSPHAPQIGADLNRRGIPAFSSPEACASVFRALRSAAALDDRSRSESRPVPGIPPAAVAQLEVAGAGSLNEAQSKQLFARFGVPVTREIVVANADDARRAAVELGGRVALKVLSATITHKTEIGGVMLGLDESSIVPAMAAMRRTVMQSTGHEPEAFLVQEMVGDGDELLLGLARDPLGTAILLGTGGIAAELFADSVLRMQPMHRPLNHDEALAMLKSLKSWPLLNGYRGKALRDTEAMARTIRSFSQMVHTLGPRLIEAEINPVFVRDAGQGVVAADGVVVIR